MSESTLDTTAPRRGRMPGPERREAILDVARGLFARQGYHGTSTGDIARAADCSEAVLYRHFPSKQALFAAVMARSAHMIKGYLADALAADPVDPIGGVPEAMEVMISRPELPDHLRLRSIAVAMVDEPEIRETLVELHAGFRQMLGDAVRTSQASGHIRDDVAPDDVAKLFAGLSFVGAFNYAIAGPDELARIVPAAAALVRVLRPPAAKTSKKERRR